MGWFDRLVDIGDGVWDAGWETGAFAVDIAMAPFVEDEYDNFFGTIKGASIHRLGNALGDLVGPDKGIGAAIGGLPQPVRSAGNTAFAGLDYAYKKTINQPLATLMTMGSIAEEKGWDAFLSTEWWGEAWEIAETRSLGQAVMIGLGTSNVFDEDEVERYMETGWYRFGSGIVDAAAAIRGDPTVILGGLVSSLRAGSSGVRMIDRIVGGGSPFRIPIIGADDTFAVMKGQERILKSITFGKGRLRHSLGSLPESKKRAFLDTVHNLGAEMGDEAGGLIHAYNKLRLADPDRARSMRAMFFTLDNPRQLARGGKITHAIDVWMDKDTQAGFELVDEVFRLDVEDVLSVKHGISMEAVSAGTMADMLDGDDVAVIASRFKKRLRTDRNTANIDQAAHMLAGAYAYGNEKDVRTVWRALMGDGAARKELADELTTALKNTRTEDLTKYVAWKAGAADDMMRLMKSQGVATRFADDAHEVLTADFILENMDEFPATVLLRNAEDAMAAGNVDLAAALTAAGDLVADVEKLPPSMMWDGGTMRFGPDYSYDDVAGRLSHLRNVLASTGVSLDEVILYGGSDDIIAWNAKRLLALELDAGVPALRREHMLKGGFIPKSQAMGSLKGIEGNLPQLRYAPQISRRTSGGINLQRRIGGTQLGQRAMSSNLYQRAAGARPFQVFTNVQPHRIIDTADDRAAEQGRRVLQAVRAPKEVVEEWHGKLITAVTQGERQRVFEQIERVAFQTIAERRGLTPEDVRHVLGEVHNGRLTAYRYLNDVRNRRFDADGTVSRMVFDDLRNGGIDIPLLATQNSKFIAMPDWRVLDRAVRRRTRRYKLYEARNEVIDAAGNSLQVLKPDNIMSFGEYTNRYSGQFLTTMGRHAHDGLNLIMKFWVPSVLLRPAWAIRVVLMDERVRQLAKFGGLISWADSFAIRRQGWQNMYREMAEKSTPFLKAIGIDKDLTAPSRLLRSSSFGAVAGGLAFGPAGIVGGAAAAGFGNAYMFRRAALGRVGIQLPSPVDGYATQQAVGNSIDRTDYMLDLMSSGQSQHMSALRGMVDETEASLRELSYTGEFETFIASQNITKWEGAFQRTFNQQLGQDTGARRAIQGIIKMKEEGRALDIADIQHAAREEVADDLARWLLFDPEGKHYASQVKHRSFDIEAAENWADQITAMSFDYMQIDGSMEKVDVNLLKKLIDPEQGQVTFDEWTEFAENLDLLPNIHGEAIQQVLGKSALTKAVDRFIENSFNLMGRIPTDTLSRQPTFTAVYQLEMTRLANSFVDDSGKVVLNQAQLRNLERQARRTALNEVRSVMYELGEASEFGDMARMIMPFFPAWQEAWTRYLGLGYDNPVFLARGALLWEADIWETDDEGNRKLTFQIPEWASTIVGNSPLFEDAFANSGAVSINKQSFSIMAGLPGFGPMVQVPMAEVLRETPQLDDVMDFMFPYGPPRDLTDAMLPAWGRRARSIGDEDDEAMAAMLRQNLKTKLTQMELGEIPWRDLEDPAQLREFLNEVRNESKALMSVRLAAALFSPAAPSFESPYQDYIEAYRQLQQESPNADAAFLELYGEEYFALTQATTRSINGIPPRDIAIEAEAKYGDLIDMYPELGALIAGGDAGGEFNRSIYRQQLRSGDREYIPLNEMATMPEQRLGWIKFSREMDWIEWQRIEMGLPNLRVKEAEVLAEQKRLFIENLADTNAAWARDYYEVDRGKWDRRIAGLKAIANTPGLGAPDEEGLTRPDFEPLGTYLGTRDFVIQELLRRGAEGGSKSLDSRENQDLADYWDDFTNTLVSSNLAFADLFYRYLENDPMRAPLAGAAPQGTIAP